AIRGPGASRLASFYLGQTLLESGRPAEAIKVLERFAAEPGVEPGFRAQARAHLGLAHFVRKDVTTARALWNSLEARDPQTKATLAAVYSRAGITEPAPVALADAVLKEIGERPALLARRADGGSAWAALARDTASDPDLLADMVAACVRHRLECAEIEPRAVRAAEAGERRKTAALNFALGTYHLRKGDLPRAVAY